MRILNRFEIGSWTSKVCLFKPIQWKLQQYDDDDTPYWLLISSPCPSSAFLRNIAFRRKDQTTLILVTISECFRNYINIVTL